MKKRFTFLLSALFALTLIIQSFSVMGQAKPDPTYEWVLVEDYSSLSTSETYVIACNINGGTAWYSLKNNQVTIAANLAIGSTLTIVNKKITSTVSDNETWVLEAVTNQTDRFYIKSTKGSYYLQNAGATKSTITSKSDTDNYNIWKIHYTDSNTNTNASVTGLYNVGVSRELACYNSNPVTWRCYTSSNYGNIQNDEVVLYKRQEVSSDPTITLSETSLTGFNYNQGFGPSASQSFIVSGSNLSENNITVSLNANSDYEMSEQDGDNWSSITSKTLTPTNGTVSETTLYVRMKSDLTGNNISGTITVATTATGVDDQTINLTGSVTPTYTLTYEATNGSISGVLSGSSTVVSNDASLVAGTTVTLTAEPASVAYKFTLWSVDGTGSTLSSTSTNPTTFTMGTANSTVTATFTARPTTKVTLHDGLNGATTTVVNTYTDATLADVIEGHDIASVNGWTALGWVKSYTLGTPTLITTSEAVGETEHLYAVYSKGSNIFTLINDVDDIALDGNYMIGYGSKIMKNVKSTNYMGYTTSNEISDGSFEYVDGRIFVLGGEADAYTFYDGSKYLSATNGQQYLGLTTSASTNYQKWTISFSGDYAMISNNGNSSNKNVSFYSKNDYFNCYTNDGAVVNLYKQTSSVNYSITPSAEKCHVTYNANGATSGDVPTDNGEYNPNDNVTVKDNTGSLAKTGHTWSGWCLNDVGTGPVYGPNYTTIYAITANTTFYAKWAANTHTVTMPDNDAYGEYSMNKSNPVAYNTEVTLTYTKASGYENYMATWSVNGTPIAGNKFNMPDADVTITVSVEEMTQASYIFNTDAGLSDLNISKPNSGAGTNLGNATYSVGLVDMTCTSGSTATRVWNTSGTLTLRIYENGTITFEVPSTPVAYVITKVEFGGTVNLTYGSNPATAVSNKTWTGQASSITFTNTSSQSQITTITVTYARLRTLSFWVNGTEAPALEKGVANGAKIGTLPTTPSGIPSGYTFDGWMDLSNSDNYYGTTAPTMVTTNTVVTDDMLLAAVFHETSTSSNYTTSIVTFDDDVIYDDLYGINYISGDVLASSFENHGLLVINNGSTLVMDDDQTLTNTTASNLVIEDGGQLIVHNDNVQATIKKTVTASAKNPTNWYTIASPVRNVNIGAVGDAGSVNNLKEEHGYYDLYRFNETKNDSGEGDYRWENYKNDDYDDFTSLVTGRGYLYRREGTATLEYVGEVNGSESEEYILTRDGAAPLTGFHLIGNPYSHDIYKGKGAAIDDTKLNEGFYRLTNGTAWTPVYYYGSAIHSGEGILVQANDVGTLTIYNRTETSDGESKYNNDNIMFSVANSQHEDVTYAVFDKGHGLNKIEHRDDNIPMLYISQNGEDYAIAMMSDDTKMFSLNFKAMTMGKYTLSYKTKGEFNYLHVIDRLTGEDVDMLLEGEYSFVASPNDSDARFIVKLAYLPDYGDGEGDIFAYQNGSDIFVSGEGELQIFDVMGRFVMSERINGVKTISADELSKGVYVLRLVGNGMKTQKIVVK